MLSVGLFMERGNVGVVMFFYAHLRDKIVTPSLDLIQPATFGAGRVALKLFCHNFRSNSLASKLYIFRVIKLHSMRTPLRETDVSIN